MRLKRLELLGFKSFADPTVLDFEHEVTGIVGPNGCGKSNVVDAIRWVLGEQRAKSMRGGEMADVVFKGSVSRPAMSLAEVSMVLDNSSGRIEDQGAEIAITRRVTPAGEGEYMVNGDRVRLKDVRNLLFDTGLGSRGYSVLEQGRIDAVLSANAIDRRAIFEEAAGISRYRQRRKETESRLKRVGQDMERLDDLLRELTSRIRSLKIQATKAEKFVLARDEWRQKRGIYLQHRVHGLGGELAELREGLGSLEEELAGLRDAREAGEAAIQALEESKRTLTARVEELAAEVSRLSGEARALEERRTQLRARIDGWRATAEEESERAETLDAQLIERRDEIHGLREAAEERAAEVEAKKDQVAARSTATRDLRGAYRDLRTASGEQNEVVLGLLHEKTAAANSVRHHEQAQEPLAARAERARHRLEEGRGQIDGAQAEWVAAQAAQAEAEENVQGHEQERSAAQAAAQEAAEEVAARLEENRRCEMERARHKERIAILRDLEREREGLESGTKAVLDAVQRESEGPGGAAGSVPCDKNELDGLLADRLRTSTRLARALDAALGDRALGIVVDSAEVAADLCRWLREGERGKACLLVPEGLAETELPIPPFCGEASELGIIGWLLDRVECEEAYMPLARELLGDVIVVDDLEGALRLVREFPTYRFVTPEGDLVDASGLVGGHQELAQGAVGRRAGAEDLERRVRELEGALERGAAQLEELEARELESQQRSAAAEEALELARRAASEANSNLKTAESRRHDLETLVEQLAREEESVAAETQRLEAELAQAQADVARFEARFEEENRKLAELEEQRHAMEAERDRLAREESEAQVELARAREQLEALNQRVRDLERACEETSLEVERARRLSKESGENAQQGERDLLDLDEVRGRLAEDLGQREGGLTEVRDRERGASQEIEVAREEHTTRNRALEIGQGQLADRKLDEQRLQLAREELLVRAEEELSLDEETLLDEFEEDPDLGIEGALEDLAKVVSDLKRTLEKLGSVNTDAVQELEETQMRFDFMDTERKDLLDARQTLLETLDKINEESERLFMETFTTVRANFQVLFRKLFGGGKADLILEEGVDPLEAGIEIIARPPGREMLSIELLSGGQRTMTALALLFAVFQAKPSPFCVLDEVDAALDDANVGRFLGMLDTFRGGTQFIIVTHNKGTMSACDALFGVTMETKGVSRHVAVEFEKVDDFVPEATGDAGKAKEARTEVVESGEAETPDGESVVEMEPGGAVSIDGEPHGAEPREDESFDRDGDDSSEDGGGVRASMSDSELAVRLSPAESGDTLHLD